MFPAMPKVEEPQSTIVSMIHQDFSVEKPGLIPMGFTIKKGSEEKPSITHIGAAKHYVYLDGDRGSLPVRDASYEVARSIVEDYITSQMGVDETSFPGLFWVPGKWTLEELKKHEEFSKVLIQAGIAHRKWMLKLTQQADDDFSRYQKHNVVSDFQRKIAEILKLKPEQHPWMSIANTLESHSCPGCGKLYQLGIAFCPNCRTVLDKEKASKLEILK